MKKITAQIVNIQVKRFAPFRPSPYFQGEQYDIKTRIELDNGHWFYTPPTDMRITLTPGGAVMTTIENDWITGGNGVLKKGTNALFPQSKLGVGQTITVRARERGARLTHVKLLAAPA